MQIPAKEADWLKSLTRRGWSWEFLRRSPAYREAYSQHGTAVADAERWALLRYEDPAVEARDAAVFWRIEDCPSVLPLMALPHSRSPTMITFDIDHVSCKMNFHHDEHGQRTDVLFSEAGRFLQLSIEVRGDLKGAHLLMPALDVPENVTARAASFRRLNDLMQHGRLRQTLYPQEPRAPRLISVLRALDGSLTGLSHREIALLIFSKSRVDSEWGGRQHHLRDKVRRAIGYGQSLMNGGYRQFLRPTYSRQIARPDLLRG